jgi:CRP/FNR family transcriptional regulator, cyclic AMP receptor protein
MSLVEEVALLRKIPLFAKLDPAKLKLLAFTSERLTFPAGQGLFHQGDPGDAAYIIIDGEADVRVNSSKGPVTVAHLGRNSFIGEIAILCDVPRTASVVATSDLITLRISKDTFLRMVNEFPEMAIEIMRELARRLDKTNEQLSLARQSMN